MMPFSSAGLVASLHSTLAQIERALEVSPDDPGLCELRRSLLRFIAELEPQKPVAA